MSVSQDPCVRYSGAQHLASFRPKSTAISTQYSLISNLPQTCLSLLILNITATRRKLHYAISHRGRRRDEFDLSYESLFFFCFHSTTVTLFFYLLSSLSCFRKYCTPPIYTSSIRDKKNQSIHRPIFTRRIDDESAMYKKHEINLSLQEATTTRLGTTIYQQTSRSFIKKRRKKNKTRAISR